MAGARPDPDVAGIQSTEAHVTPEPPRGAAFFDVDNTMMVGASIFHFAKGLAARKFFDWHDLVRFTVRQAKLRTRGESKGDMHATRDSALAFVAGKKVTEIVALGEEIYDETMADKIWSGTHALARGHLAAGRQVWLVTATPQELAQIIADRLGLTGALGTIAATNDGEYTGRLVGDVLHGEAKAHAVARARGPRGSGSRAVQRLLRLDQRPAAAVSLVGTAGGGQPGFRAAGRGATIAGGRSATSAPAARRSGSACRSRSAHQPSPVGSPRP